MAGAGRKRARESDGSNGHTAKRHRINHRTHTTTAGVVLTCGEGDVGQLGLGEDVMERTRPGLVDLPEEIVQVCAGGMHTVCLAESGTVYTFGCNDEGALGRDTSEEGTETRPDKVELGAKIVQVSAGDSHTAALSDDGRIFIWGNFRDASGSIGLTKDGIQTKPIQILSNETTVKIASGGDHLCCLTDKGELYTLGCAEQGQLGRIAECFAGRGGRKGLDLLLTPEVVRCRRYKTKRKAEFSDVWAGQYFTYAQEKVTGDVYSWGLNNYFQLGFDDMINRFVPERIASFSNGKQWQKIHGGQHHAVALDSEGKVYCLGRAEYGRLGLGEDAKETAEPTLVTALQENKCVDVTSGQAVSFALTEDGTLYSWGMGTSKQLATGDEDDVLTPTKMGGKQLENRVGIQIASGGQHTVILAKNKGVANS